MKKIIKLCLSVTVCLLTSWPVLSYADTNDDAATVYRDFLNAAQTQAMSDYNALYGTIKPTGPNNPLSPNSSSALSAMPSVSSSVSTSEPTAPSVSSSSVTSSPGTSVTVPNNSSSSSIAPIVG